MEKNIPIEIKSILGKKTINNKTKYLIEWIDGKFTYEPKENLLNCESLIKEIDKNNKRVFPSEKNNLNECKYFNTQIDYPLNIVSVKKSNNQILYEIQWKKRDNNLVPENYFANTDFLLKYYRTFFLNFLTSQLVP